VPVSGNEKLFILELNMLIHGLVYSVIKRNFHPFFSLCFDIIAISVIVCNAVRS
jgi:hypothetical protein